MRVDGGIYQIGPTSDLRGEDYREQLTGSAEPIMRGTDVSVDIRKV